MKRLTHGVRLALTQPGTLFTASANVVMWTLVTLLGLLNVAINVWLKGINLWTWLIINLALLFFGVTMLKWAVYGLLWRKDLESVEAKQRAADEAFHAIVVAEFKRST